MPDFSYSASDAAFVKPDLSFAKIVTVPKPLSWSQGYNAGSLFAVLTLNKDKINNEEGLDSLNTLGKNTLSTFEEEFFTLDFKDLASIKQAIANTLEKIQENITYSFAVTFFAPHKNGAEPIKNVLYLFTVGKALISIKRGAKFGTLLNSLEDNPKYIASSSGFLENNDLIILSTNSIADILTNEGSAVALENLSPSEIAEILAPKINEKEDRELAAIIIRYNEPKIYQQKSSKEEDMQQENTQRLKKYIAFLKKYFPTEFSHSKKVFLTLALIILIILILSIFFAIKKQNNAKIQAQFNKIYPQAQKDYSQGNSLLGLNKNLARENFIEAQKILENAKSQFAKNSKEETQILELFKKVNDGLVAASGISLVESKIVDNKSSKLLSSEIQIPQADFFVQDDKNIYYIDNNTVSSVIKGKEKVNTLIKNNNLWKDIGGLGVYLGNIYVLDKKQKQILKFVQIGSGYSKTNYFTQDLSPDFSKASSMAIDGSIWVILNDGTIERFTRGKEDHFAVSGLDKPFLNPTRIYTDVDTKNLYILDNSNSRIVVLNKEGIYQTQYQADILKNAKDFEVLEKDKKIFILSSQNKIYEIEIK